MKNPKNKTEKNIPSVEEPMAIYMPQFHSKSKVIQLINQDISSKQLFNQVLEASGKTIQYLAKFIFEMTPKTFIKYKNTEVKLPSRVAELAIELNAMYQLGHEVFGDKEAFNEWLEEPHSFFYGKPPAQFLNTSAGIGLIVEELKRIEFGATA